jgi:hypothetical protein
MDLNRVARTQQIAVFGESGSGKTVLLSAFYGAALEPRANASRPYDVVADDAAQGTRLHQNYLGMKNAGSRPPANRFATTSYSFTVKNRQGAGGSKGEGKAAPDLRLIWHDYPGEWFEQEPSSTEEARRRLETFEALLTSDVALILIDGQKLLDNAGEEERYLKGLFANLRNAFLKIESSVLKGGKRRVSFPRIWIIGLSKSDLMPDLDVIGLRDFVIEKAGGEVSQLRDTIATFVEDPEALSLGEDFVITSSARFEPGQIDVSKRIGVDLVLPIAAMLPYSRFVRWARALRDGSKVAEHLVQVASPVLLVLINKVKLPGPLKLIQVLFSTKMTREFVDLSQDRIREVHQEAEARHDFLAATLTRFQLDLDASVEAKVLYRSPKA